MDILDNMKKGEVGCRDLERLQLHLSSADLPPQKLNSMFFVVLAPFFCSIRSTFPSPHSGALCHFSQSHACICITIRRKERAAFGWCLGGGVAASRCQSPIV